MLPLGRSPRSGTVPSVYVVREACALAQKIGEWSEGMTSASPGLQPPMSISAGRSRFSFAMEQNERAKAAKRTVDTEAIRAQSGHIRDALKRIANLHRHATRFEARLTRLPVRRTTSARISSMRCASWRRRLWWRAVRRMRRSATPCSAIWESATAVGRQSPRPVT